MVFTDYLQTHKEKKTHLNIFLDNKVMLEGLITTFDEDCIVLDKCLIFREHIISIKPQ